MDEKIVVVEFKGRDARKLQARLPMKRPPSVCAEGLKASPWQKPTGGNWSPRNGSNGTRSWAQRQSHPFMCGFLWGSRSTVASKLGSSRAPVKKLSPEPCPIRSSSCRNVYLQLPCDQAPPTITRVCSKHQTCEPQERNLHLAPSKVTPSKGSSKQRIKGHRPQSSF